MHFEKEKKSIFLVQCCQEFSVCAQTLIYDFGDGILAEITFLCMSGLLPWLLPHPCPQLSFTGGPWGLGDLAQETQ